MKCVAYPDNAVRPLPFYLATEEYVAGHFPSGEYLFAWRVNPTVICGRHQIMSLEVNLQYCRDHSIDVVRRKSGGGCVYADMNNVMFSYIAPSQSVEKSFTVFTNKICRMLQSLGIKAEVSGRNDIVVNDQKISGNAMYTLLDRSIVHGTMLVDADFSTMAQAITPSKAKLVSKGVKSVQSRVTDLHTCGLKMSCDEFVDFALQYLCDEKTVHLSEFQLSEISEIMKTYYAPEFYNDRVSKKHSSIRKPELGEMSLSLDIGGDRMIYDVHLSGDFMSAGDAENALCEALRGCRLEQDSVSKAIINRKISGNIIGLTDSELIDLILNN